MEANIYFWRLLGRPKHKDRLIATQTNTTLRQSDLAGYRKIKSKIGRFSICNDY